MRAVTLCAALFALSSFAQEIGTELEPVGPKAPATTPVPQPVDNPYAAPTPAPEPTPTPTPAPEKAYKPRGQKRDAEPTWEGERLSGATGSFGVRGSFGGAAIGALGTTGPAPTVGMTYWATDGVALLFDVGAGLALTNRGANIGFAAGIGLNVAMGNPGLALRPLFHASVSGGMPVSPNFDTFVLAAQVGGGAEYFFSPNFSVNALLLVAVPVTISNGGLALGVYTASPGIGGTLYF